MSIGLIFYTLDEFTKFNQQHNLNNLLTRAKMLQHSMDILSQQSRLIIAGQDGLRGIGKTAFAAQIITHHLQLNQIEWVIWVRGEGFSLPPHNVDDIDLETINGEISTIPDGLGVLVFDNFLTVGVDFDTFFLQYITLIITPESPALLSKTPHMVVGGFTVAESLTLLKQQLAPETIPELIVSDLKKILQQLNGVAEGILILARYLKFHGLTATVVTNIMQNMGKLSRLPNPFHKAKATGSATTYALTRTVLGVMKYEAIRWFSPAFGGMLATNESVIAPTISELITGLASGIGVVQGTKREIVSQHRAIDELDNTASELDPVAFTNWLSRFNPEISVALASSVQTRLINNEIRTSMRDYVLQWNQLAFEVARERGDLVSQQRAQSLLGLAAGPDYDPQPLIDIYEQLPTQTSLRGLVASNLANWFLNHSQPAQAYIYFEKAVADYQHSRQPGLEGLILLAMAQLNLSADKIDLAREQANTSLSRFLAANANYESAQAYTLLGDINYLEGNYGGALREYERAFNQLVPIVQEIEPTDTNVQQLSEMLKRSPTFAFINDFRDKYLNVSLWFRAMTLYADVLQRIGEIQGFGTEKQFAVDYLISASNLYQQLGQTLQAANCYVSLANLYQRWVDHEAATSDDYYLQALQLYSDLGSQVGISISLIGRAQLAHKYSTDDAAELLSQAKNEARKISAPNLMRLLEQLA